MPPPLTTPLGKSPTCRGVFVCPLGWLGVGLGRLEAVAGTIAGTAEWTRTAPVYVPRAFAMHNPLPEPCTVCGERSPQVSYFFLAGQVVRVPTFLR
jgi:hypothetical protein